MRHNYIGEIENQGAGELPTLSCEMINDAEMALILCDEKGRTHFEKKYKLSRGINNLTLQLADLKKGEYNIWIQIQGKTFLRKLNIEKKEAKGLFKTVGKLFKSYV